MKRMRRKVYSGLLDCLIVLFSVGIICFCGMAVRADCRYRDGREAYEKLRQTAWKGRAAPGEAFSQEKKRKADAADSGPQLLPVIDEEALKRQNQEYLFWLYIPGTEINYPVVRNKDNRYYLNHTFTGEENLCGSIFADSLTGERSGAAVEKNMVIHGHNMRDGSMFGGLKKYEKQQYFNSIPNLWIYFGGRWHCGRIFSCRIAAEGDGEARQVFFAPGERAAYLEAAYAGALYDTGIVPGEDGGLVTLSTCHRSGGKLMVHAVFNERE